MRFDDSAPKAVTFDVLMREFDLRSFDSAAARFFERAVAEALHVATKDVIIRAARAAGVLASVQVYESPARRASDLEETLLAYEDSKSSLPLEGFGESEVGNERAHHQREEDARLRARRDARH